MGAIIAATHGYIAADIFALEKHSPVKKTEHFPGCVRFADPSVEAHSSVKWAIVAHPMVFAVIRQVTCANCSFGTLLDDRDPDVRQAFGLQSSQKKQAVSNCTAFLGIVEHEYELCASDKTLNCVARQCQGFPNVPMVGVPFLCVGIEWLDPRQMWHEAKAVGCLLKGQIVDVNRGPCGMIGNDETVEYRLIEGIGESGVGLANPIDMLRQVNRVVPVQGAEKQHVPHGWQLANIECEFIAEL